MPFWKLGWLQSSHRTSPLTDIDPSAWWTVLESSLDLSFQPACLKDGNIDSSSHLFLQTHQSIHSENNFCCIRAVDRQEYDPLIKVWFHSVEKILSLGLVHSNRSLVSWVELKPSNSLPGHTRCDLWPMSHCPGITTLEMISPVDQLWCQDAQLDVVILYHFDHLIT